MSMTWCCHRVQCCAVLCCAGLCCAGVLPGTRHMDSSNRRLHSAPATIKAADAYQYSTSIFASLHCSALFLQHRKVTLEQKGLCLSNVHKITSKQQHAGLLHVLNLQPCFSSGVSVFCVIACAAFIICHVFCVIACAAFIICQRRQIKDFRCSISTGPCLMPGQALLHDHNHFIILTLSHITLQHCTAAAVQRL